MTTQDSCQGASSQWLELEAIVENGVTVRLNDSPRIGWEIG